jgi:hypothetical protein
MVILDLKIDIALLDKKNKLIDKNHCPMVEKTSEFKFYDFAYKQVVFICQVKNTLLI